MEKVRVASTQDSVINWKPVPGVKAQHIAVGAGVSTPSPLDPRTVYCVLNIQGGTVRTEFDGDNPVAGSHGCLMPAGTYMYWGVDMVRAMRFTRETGTDALVWIQQCVKPTTSPAT